VLVLIPAEKLLCLQIHGKSLLKQEVEWK